MGSELRELWTVESGSYSDWRIHAVFENEEDAETWAAAIRGEEGGWHSDASVGRLTLVPAGVKPRRITTWEMEAELWDDGRVLNERVHSYTEYPITALHGPPPKRPCVRYVRAPIHGGYGGRIEVRGATEKSVRKVFSERVAMWKAGSWAGPGHAELVEPADAD